MSKAKKPQLLKLSELQHGQAADFFALLAEKTRNTTRDGSAWRRSSSIFNGVPLGQAPSTPTLFSNRLTLLCAGER